MSSFVRNGTESNVNCLQKHYSSLFHRDVGDLEMIFYSKDQTTLPTPPSPCSVTLHHALSRPSGISQEIKNDNLLTVSDWLEG